MRDALIVFHPLPSLFERFLFFCSEKLVVDGRICYGTGHGIDHSFEKAADGGNLARRETINERVNLLLRMRGVRWHGSMASSFHSTVELKKRERRDRLI
jgi:hypothetical protein